MTASQHWMEPQSCPTRWTGASGAHFRDHCGHVVHKQRQGVLGSIARHIGVAGTPDVVGDDMKSGGEVPGDWLPGGPRVGKAVDQDHRGM